MMKSGKCAGAGVAEQLIPAKGGNERQASPASAVKSGNSLSGRIISELDCRARRRRARNDGAEDIVASERIYGLPRLFEPRNDGGRADCVRYRNGLPRIGRMSYAPASPANPRNDGLGGHWRGRSDVWIATPAAQARNDGYLLPCGQYIEQLDCHGRQSRPRNDGER